MDRPYLETSKILAMKVFQTTHHMLESHKPLLYRRALSQRAESHAAPGTSNRSYHHLSISSTVLTKLPIASNSKHVSQNRNFYPQYRHYIMSSLNAQPTCQPSHLASSSARPNRHILVRPFPRASLPHLPPRRPHPLRHRPLTSLEFTWLLPFLDADFQPHIPHRRIP